MKDLIFFVLIFIGAVSFAIWGFVLKNELKEKNKELYNCKEENAFLINQMKSDSSILVNYQEAIGRFINQYPSEYLHFESIMEKLETE